MKTRSELMREQKRQHILESSRRVFSEKGFSRVTMQDLIDASKISRGGIYLYFKSVEEVFNEIILQRERWLINRVNQIICEGKSFESLLDEYLFLQKKRLLNIQDSLIKATYEYYFDYPDSRLRYKQMENMKETIDIILDYGVSEAMLDEYTLNSLSRHIIIFIEGLNLYAFLGDLNRNEINQQLSYLKKVILHG